MAKGRTTIIIKNEKYSYEKCNRVIKIVINNRHANVSLVQPVKGKRLILGDYERNGLDHKRNKCLKETPAKHEESGLVTRYRFKHITKNTVKKEVKEEDQTSKCNQLQQKNSNRRIEEKNSDDDTSTEVEILDSDEVIKQGILSAFVPSTINRSVFPKANSEYRKRVLNVLKKPFEKEEYRRLSDEVKFYIAKYPSLKKKLSEYRYKRLTGMTILRGFFYWLQNVMHDEAFQPWEDSQCLAVQPGSGQEN